MTAEQESLIPAGYLGLTLLCSQCRRVGRSDADTDNIADSHNPTLSTIAADHLDPLYWMDKLDVEQPLFVHFYFSYALHPYWNELSDEKRALGLKFGRSSGRKRSIEL